MLFFTPTSFISSTLSVTKCCPFSLPLLYLEFCHFLISVVTVLVQDMIISCLDYCSRVIDDPCLCFAILHISYCHPNTPIWLYHALLLKILQWLFFVSRIKSKLFRRSCIAFCGLISSWLYSLVFWYFFLL